jgi:transposase
MHFDLARFRVVGGAGELAVPVADEVTPRLLMLIEGQCEGLGAIAAAEKYKISRSRYFQLLKLYEEEGVLALLPQKRGPKAPHVRTDEVVRQVIRHRFLDPNASAAVIAQKLNQSGFAMSVRSVERVVADYGLQKKTL